MFILFFSPRAKNRNLSPLKLYNETKDVADFFFNKKAKTLLLCKNGKRKI